MSRPTPWPVPCRKASLPAGVARCTDRQASSTSRARRPRPAPRPRPRPATACTTSSIRRWVADGLADHDRAGHVRVVAVDQRAEVDARRGRPRRCGGRRPGGGAWRRSGPDATIVSNDGPSAPRRRICHSSSRATSASVGPSPSRWRTAARAASAMRAGGLDAGDLAGVLHPPQVLDQALGGHQLGLGEPVGAVAALLRPGDAPRPRGRAGPPAGDLRRAGAALLVGRCARSAIVGVDPGRRELARRLVAVAAVGHEHQVVGPDQQQGGRPGEPGEVADVGEVGDEQGVAAGRVEARPAAGVARSATSIGGREARSKVTPRQDRGRRRPARRPSGVEQAGDGLDRQQVAEPAEAGDRAGGDRRHHRACAATPRGPAGWTGAARRPARRRRRGRRGSPRRSG